MDSPKKATVGSSSGNFKREEPEQMEEDDEDDLPCMMISSINRVSEAGHVDVLVDKIALKMEIDCGSAETVISEKYF